jgi:putative MFS transporter
MSTLSPQQKRIIAIVSTAGFFENYDRALLSLAVEQIQRGLRVSERHLGQMLSVIRLGYLLSLPIASLADRFGRRRLLVHTIIIYTLATGASALAPGVRSFVGFQFIARAFSAAETAVALVVVSEEVDAAVRGTMIGWLGALSATGYGLAALVFALINVMPWGWRGLYLLALLPLALVMPLRRLLPETQRFSELSRRGHAPGALSPLRDLWRHSRGRLSILLVVTFMVYLGGTPASFLSFKYLEDVHHWSPGEVSTMVIFAGAFGILGSIAAGHLSDRVGRRLISAVAMFVAPLLMLLFLHSSGPLMIFAWGAELFFDTASTTMLNTFGTELFPTAYRSTASSAMVVAATVGAALGLWLEAILYAVTGSHWSAVSLLTAVWILAPIFVLGWFPETAGMELELTSAPTAGKEPR